MPRNSKQYNHLKKARLIHLNQKNLAFSKININENLLEDTNIDEYQNSNQQILVDQIINLTFGLSETSVILLIEIAQQLTNDQCSNEKHTIDKRIQLLQRVLKFNNNELELASSLLVNMRYTKGSNTGEIFSKYLQKKAVNYIETTIYKTSIDSKNIQKINQSQQNHIISLKKKLKSLHGKVSKYNQLHRQIKLKAKNPSKVTKSQLKAMIHDLLLENKNEYSAKTVLMATKVCQIGQMSYQSAVKCTKSVIEWLIDEEPDKWFSARTLVGWHKEVSAINLRKQCEVVKKSEYFTFGIMADESTRGDCKLFVICFMYWDSNANVPKITLLELKNLNQCTGAVVSQIVTESCKQHNLDPSTCQTWVTDNTAYMSGNKNGAMVLFNKENKTNSFRISCGMHSAHIMMINFENKAFGKLKVNTGFSNQKHPFNLIYLVWQLHQGYNESDKDNPMNMKTSYISKLYFQLFGEQFSKFQKPLRQRWLYELQGARQLVQRRNLLEEFTEWFLKKLNEQKNIPKTYIAKWELLQEWLADPILKLQIESLVEFGEKIYEPIMDFLVKSEEQPRILHNDGNITRLLPGRRAHEMPDTVLHWIQSLKAIKSDPYDFFSTQIWEAITILQDDDFENFVNGLVSGIDSALNSLETWMGMWLHLPLSICRLGGNYGHKFACSYLNTIIGLPWKYVPNLKELCYAKQLELDLENQKELNDFGLHMALNNPLFKEEFINFAYSPNLPIYEFPLLYEFVKSRIYYIVIHQQQIEGLFNKYDLKCHPNMTNETKQAKLQLAFENTKNISLTTSDLHEERKRKRMENTNEDNTSLNYGVEEADRLFNELFVKKKRS
ncbi:unnamed protein product [Rhizophagus irregularis]|nr:unnamed protein product [Rhizophagus irregularis]